MKRLAFLLLVPFMLHASEEKKEPTEIGRLLSEHAQFMYLYHPTLKQKVQKLESRVRELELENYWMQEAYVKLCNQLAIKPYEFDDFLLLWDKTHSLKKESHPNYSQQNKE